MTKRSTEFGIRLRKFALGKYGSIKELSEQTGIDRTRLSKYLNGHAMPRRDQMQKLAESGVNVNWLLTGEGEMEASAIDFRLGEAFLRWFAPGSEPETANAQRQQNRAAQEPLPEVLKRLRQIINELEIVYQSLAITTTMKPVKDTNAKTKKG